MIHSITAFGIKQGTADTTVAPKHGGSLGLTKAKVRNPCNGAIVFALTPPAVRPRVRPKTGLTPRQYRDILRISAEDVEMVTKIKKWGNSQGLRISKRVLEDADVSLGDEVDVVVRNGEIVIRPVRRVRRKYKLADLVKAIPSSYRPAEVDWGEPRGKDVW